METTTEQLVREQEAQRWQRYFMHAIEQWARKSFRIYARTFEEQEAVDGMKLDLALTVGFDEKNSLQVVVVENMPAILKLLPENVSVISTKLLEQCGVDRDLIKVASDHAESMVARQSWQAKDLRLAGERDDD